MEIEARHRRGSIHAELLGHAVQVGQSEVNTAHRKHTGLEQVDVPIVVTGNLKAESDTLKYRDAAKSEIFSMGIAPGTFPSTAMGGWYSSVCHSPNKARSFSFLVSDIILALRERFEKPFTILNGTDEITNDKVSN